MIKYDDKQVEYAIRLVHQVSWKMSKGDYETYEDYVSIGFIGATRALQTYNPITGFEFSTYATRCIRNSIKCEFRKQRVDTSASLDKIIEEEGKVKFADIIPDNLTNIEDVVIYNDMINNLFKELDNIFTYSEKKMFLYMFHNPGYPQYKIGKKLGYSTSYASRLARRCKKKVVEYLIKEGYKVREPKSYGILY